MIFALDVGNTNIVLGVFGSDYKSYILGALRQIILKLKMNFMLLFEISSLIKG